MLNLRAGVNNRNKASVGCISDCAPLLEGERATSRECMLIDNEGVAKLATTLLPKDKPKQNNLRQIVILMHTYIRVFSLVDMLPCLE